jgi:hypothetical protein
MSIKARYADGVFEPLERVKDDTPGKIYRVFSEEEFRNLAEELGWLAAAERSFEFWNNEEDAVYDNL